MSIQVGDRLPDADVMRIGPNGPEKQALAPLLSRRKVVIFAVPGAFTPTCDSAHVPSFIRVMPDLAAKGVDQVICLSVNDPWVMQAWGDTTGANAAGITMLADPDCDLTEAIGMRFDAPPAGLLARSIRYAMLVEDGVVTRLHLEEARGVCDRTAGEAMLAAI